MTQKMNNTNTNNLNVSPRIRRQQRRRRRRRGFWGGDPLWKSCGGGVPLERAPSFCETNEFLSEKKKELCLGFRVSFNASLQFFFCVDKLFVSSFVLSLFIYYKRLRRRRSDHLDFPNDEAIVFCVHGHVEHSFFVRVDEKTRDAFEGNVALTDAKAGAAGFL